MPTQINLCRPQNSSFVLCLRDLLRSSGNVAQIHGRQDQHLGTLYSEVEAGKIRFSESTTTDLLCRQALKFT